MIPTTISDVLLDNKVSRSRSNCLSGVPVISVTEHSGHAGGPGDLE